MPVEATTANIHAKIKPVSDNKLHRQISSTGSIRNTTMPRSAKVMMKNNQATFLLR